jgi:hypothetical protein
MIGDALLLYGACAGSSLILSMGSFVHFPPISRSRECPQ